MAEKPIVLGIDLGTTNTCVAYVRNKIARVVPSDKGALILPSVVAISDKGELLVGNVAKDQMVVNPRNSIYGAKRLIGRKYNSKVVQDIKHYFTYEIVEGPEGEAAVMLAGKVYSMPQISAFVLQHCKRVAEATLAQEIKEAVISVPAYYNDNQRQAVKEAGRLAGFEVKRIVNEPTAAALAYGLNRGFDHKVLVYDLGGGTFDVSVLQLHGNVMEVLATGGDTFLGGVDFDNRIIDFVIEEFREQTKIDLTDSPIAMQRIKNACEAAKIDLSLLSNVVVELPYIGERRGKPVDLRIPLSRERLNTLVMDLVERTFELVDKVLGEKNIPPNDIAEVLLVGGQTRMPLVQGKTHQHFGKPPRKGVHPDESVALGAALLAESMSEIDSVTLVDALSMPIGFAMPGGRFRKVIEKNTQIPAQRSFRLPPGRPGGLELDIFQGDSERIIDNEYLGTLRFPPETAGQKVNFILDEECLLHVTVEGLAGDAQPKEVLLATRDTPDTLKAAWAEENERRRVLAEQQIAEQAVPKGLFASIRKAFGRE
ncbi:MAG TPA: Hsp70 family protein [Myxococcales bacterium]|nr:Hsp70 family protein [Myxococcales bacterium]